MKCAICKKIFPEEKLELSHNIPKYIGGTDLDGRHYLCAECHDVYERKILSSCCENVFHYSITKLKNRKFLIPHMTMIKNSSIKEQQKCLEIAKEIKKEVFENE